MSSIVLSGDTSGQVSLTVPAIAGSNTATIPASTGNVLMDSTVGVCRAWVNYKGVATRGINASFNVSSVTANATGDYTFNFTNALSDANYAVVGTVVGSQTAVFVEYSSGGVGTAPTLKSTTQIRVVTVNSANSLADNYDVNVAIFR